MPTPLRIALTVFFLTSVLTTFFLPFQTTLAQTQPGSLITLSNAQLSRTIRLTPSGEVLTRSFLNRLTNTQYLNTTSSEFRLLLSHELTGDNTTVELGSQDFQLTSYNFSSATNPKILQLDLRGTFAKNPIALSLFYEVGENTNFMRKWLKIAPFNAPGWVIRQVILEDWQATPDMDPVGLVQRYPTFYANQPEPLNYSLGRDLSLVDAANSGQRFREMPYSQEVALYRDNQQGIYFFTESLFGKERFDGRLILSHDDFIEPAQGFTSSGAVIGVWQGSPEIGFKRRNDYLRNYYAVIKDKKEPVWFNSWYVYEDKVNTSDLSDTVDRMQAARYYDVLHIDAGWEKDAPLQFNTDPDKFPQGLDPLIGKLNATGLGLGLWMNPFSGHYQDITSYQPFRDQHPEWVARDGLRICPLSGAGQYIRKRLLEIARSWPLKILYWDGADWNISGCDAKEQGWRTPAEEHILTLKFYAHLLEELHALQPDLRVIVWSPPPDVHWLRVADQVQLSDIDTPPIGVSELIRRQQLYQASFQQPSSSIWGDWYGLQYRRSWEEGLGLPLNRLAYAEMSQLGNGATQAGGSYALEYAPPELTDFVTRMFLFRKHFETYFMTYQHVLGFPDGYHIEGEAHLKNGQGFIIMYNPAEQEQAASIPLDEPELELAPDQAYTLSDWSELSGGVSLGEYKPTEAVKVSLPGQSWKVIGINISGQEN